MQLEWQQMFISLSCVLSADASTYAHFLFNAFDTDHNGSVSFEVSWVTKFVDALLYRLIFKWWMWTSSNIWSSAVQVADSGTAAFAACSCVDFNSSRDGTNRRLIFMRGIYFLIGTEELSLCQTMKLCWLILKSIQLKSPGILHSQKKSQANTSN